MKVLLNSKVLIVQRFIQSQDLNSQAPVHEPSPLTARTGPNPIKIIFSITLYYAGFEHTD